MTLSPGKHIPFSQGLCLLLSDMTSISNKEKSIQDSEGQPQSCPSTQIWGSLRGHLIRHTSFSVRSTAWNTTEYSWKWINLQPKSFIVSSAFLYLLEDFCYPGFWDKLLSFRLLCLLWWPLLPRCLMCVLPTFLLFVQPLASPWLISLMPTAPRIHTPCNSQNYISGPNLSLGSLSLVPGCPTITPPSNQVPRRPQSLLILLSLNS